MSQKIKFYGCCFVLGLIFISLLGCNGETAIEPKNPAPMDTADEPEPIPATEPQKMDPIEKPVPPAEPRVQLQTTMGAIIIELNSTAAPITVENFLRYVNDGYYEGVIFHRVIPGFMIQGGGMTADMQQKMTRPPIVNEAANGLKNERGTIAMARTPDPDSATSQFFINVVDNAPRELNYTGPSNPGYAVFGKVIEGMEVVDAIAAVETTTVGRYNDVPATPIVIQKASVVQ